MSSYLFWKVCLCFLDQGKKEEDGGGGDDMDDNVGNRKEGGDGSGGASGSGGYSFSHEAVDDHEHRYVVIELCRCTVPHYPRKPR